MGCFGIFNLLREKSKRSLPTSRARQTIYIIPNVPLQAYQPHGRIGVYESPQFRMTSDDYCTTRTAYHYPHRILIKPEPELRRSRLPRRESEDSSKTKEPNKSSKSNVAKDKKGSFKTRTQARKPWWDSTCHELRDEFESCRANAPRIDEDFLWRDRRDSLEEGSILAARGQGSSREQPQRGCKRDCLCPRCLAQLLKERKRPLMDPDDMTLLQSFPKPSRIPGPAASTRRGSSSSGQSSRTSSRSSSPDRTNQYTSSSEAHDRKHPKTSDSESMKGEKV
ncbi:hypothetical protein F4805DRAFT_421423 [Annulohypoxylon moriforme]|nr:hypothetical protein F4805DRAFT_421423 [Annulohypoxylon moriforme]